MVKVKIAWYVALIKGWEKSMKYKREETFRYEFAEEFNCVFKIISIDGVTLDSSLSEGIIIDLSPSGLKLFSPLDIPSEKNIVFHIEFTLNEKQLKLPAIIVWKRNVGNGFHYGLNHQGTEEDTSLLIDELKMYAKKNLKK